MSCELYSPLNKTYRILGKGDYCIATIPATASKDIFIFIVIALTTLSLFYFLRYYFTMSVVDPDTLYYLDYIIISERLTHHGILTVSSPGLQVT